MEDDDSDPHEADDTLAVGEREVDVGAEPHLVVHPRDDHDVAHEAEHDDTHVSADALW